MDDYRQERLVCAVVMINYFLKLLKQQKKTNETSKHYQGLTKLPSMVCEMLVQQFNHCFISFVVKFVGFRPRSKHA